MLPGWEFDAILSGITDRAIAYLDERSRSKEPFFLYFPLTSPHEPIAPSAAFRGASGLNPLADFIIETDASVGRLLAALERDGLAENTLVIFTADNGSNLLYGGRELQKMGHEPSAQFRGTKRSIYEGGHRVPFFARWPGMIEPGSRADETICLTDIFPTIAAILKKKLPADAAPDGCNILPALLGQKATGPIREATVHQATSGQLAIRQERWKLIVPLRFGGGEAKQLELYDLSADISEKENVAGQHPEIVMRLSALLDKYQREGHSRR
jgi:arylsulfatase A